ncbi:MAG: hypothetical protein QM770_14680 [Tepidisphaeraceae bacterium]
MRPTRFTSLLLASSAGLIGCAGKSAPSNDVPSADFPTHPVATSQPIVVETPPTTQQTIEQPISIPAATTIDVVRGPLPLVYQLTFGSQFNVVGPDGRVVATLTGKAGDFVSVTAQGISVAGQKVAQKLNDQPGAQYTIQIVQPATNVYQRTHIGPSP